MLQLTLLLIASLLSLCVAEVFHVNATHPASPDQDCPQPCHTLDQYAQNTSLFAGHTNISLVFLDGVHILNNMLNIDGVEEISLQPRAESLQTATSSVVVRGVEQPAITLTGQTIAVYKLKFDSVDVIEFVQGPFPILSTTVSECDIMNGSLRSYRTIHAVIILHKVALSNGVMSISSNGSASVTSVSVRECVIMNEGGFFVGEIYGGENGEFFVEIMDSNFEGPSETVNGITAQLIYGSNLTLNILNCSITQYETALHVYRVFGSMFVTITKTKIFENTLAGLFINAAIDSNATFQNDLINYNITIEETHIYNNDMGVTTIQIPSSGVDTEGIGFKGATLPFSKERIVFRDCEFYRNRGSPVLAYQSSFELVGENTFYDNTAERGAGVALFSSTVHFGLLSRTTFVNNTANKYGGAIYISTVQPLIPAVVTTIENWQKQAFSELYSVSSYSLQCFYSSDSGAQVIFHNNKAEFGGIDIFGPAKLFDIFPCVIVSSDIFSFSDLTLEVTSNPTRVCFCVDNVSQCTNRTYLVLNETRYPGESFNASVVLVGYAFGQVSGPVYTETLDSFSGEIADSQQIQSVHYKQCNNLTYTVTSEKTNHSVILALTAQEQFTQGDRENEVENSLRNLYNSECADSIECTLPLTTPVYIHVILEDCPLGFELTKTNRVCDCDENLGRIRDSDQTVVKCEIRDHTGFVTRRGTMWIGANKRVTNTGIYYWHRYCPRDYCIRSQISIDLRCPDKQCSSNRSGLLCGKCQAGYSLELGGNKCIECTNDYYLALLIVFAILGILLVALIKLLDLTVTNATINGLIFYANIVWTNNAILFPNQGVGYYIITVPIAWINLDFGIETCFSRNLDQLTKTGLQFVFPVYIWCIAGLIIVISHYSTRATKLFGNNSVAVLATLFLLSYGKLSRTITNVFTYADVSDSNGEINKVWSLDGNVQYGVTPGHIVLIVVALLFLILFLLPFTLTLLLVPFLRGKSHLRPLHWINKFKPFFDTYYGPFKDKKQHHVWTGILLVSRVVILIVNASTSTSSPNANILAMTLIATTLQLYSAFADLLYKKWYLSVLETLYLFNLITLAGAFLFYQTLSPEDRQNDQLSPVAATSVCIALVQLVCILVFHVAKQIGSNVTCPRKSKVTESMGYERYKEDTQDSGKSTSKVTTQVVEINNSKKVKDYTALRESLII